MARMFPARRVGRTSELEELESAVGAASLGSPMIVLLGGEAGIGKTFLLDELMRRAAARNVRVVLGHCIELSGGGLPYGPVIEAGRSLAFTLDEPTRRRLLAPAEAELARLLQLGAEEGQAGRTPSFGQTRLFDYVLRVLTELCRESPVLLAVEDLHRVDRSTLDLLSFLVRNLRDEPAMLCVTYRSDELHGHPAVREFLADQGRDRRTQRIELAGFGREELAIQLGDLLDGPPTDEMLDRILARSGGNPYFAEELVAFGVGERGTMLPETLLEAILTRVERLTAEAQEILRIAAAADRRVSHRLLAAITELPERAMLRALREAVTSRFLVADTRSQSYTFRHALVREAIYADQQPADLAWLHGAIARVLEQDPTLSGDQVVTPAVELAHHWDAAGDLPRALLASVEAGRSAAAIFAFTEAHRQFQRALRLWPQVPGAAERVGVAHYELLQEASNVALWADGVERALALIEEGLAEVDPVREPAKAGALLECEGRYLWRSGRNDRSLAAHAEAVRLLAAEPPSPVRARALAGYGTRMVMAGRYSESKLICQDAIAMARTIGARLEESHALNSLGVARTMSGEVEAGLRNLHDAVRIAEELDDFEERYRGHSNLAFALENAGRVEEAVEIALHGLRVAQRIPEAKMATGALLTNATDQLILLGRWQEAGQLLADAPQMKAVPRWGPYLNRAQAELDTFAGRFDLAEERLEAHLKAHLDPTSPAAQLTDPQFHGSLHTWLAELAIWRGSRDAARAAVDRGLFYVAQGEDDQLAVQLCALGLRADADEVERQQAVGGDAAVQVARSSGAELLARARGLMQRPAGRRPVLPEATWAALLCEGEHARLEGRSHPAHWEAAATVSDDLHQPYRAAYARFRQAEALLDEGATDDAEVVLRQAHHTAVQLGAHPLRELIESLALRHRLDPWQQEAQTRT
jgi:tetratricopeptide (TPR) repeat protein